MPRQFTGDVMPEISRKILCVDDDTSWLSALERQLRRKFDITTAIGGPAGLELLAGPDSFAVVTVDFRMPGMNGIEFLREARRVSPDNTVALMLTGCAQLDVAVSALHDGQIYRFLTKPCSPELLEATLADCVEKYRAVATERLLNAQLSHANAELRAESEKLRSEIDEHKATQELLSQVQIALDDAEMERLCRIEERERVQERLARIQMALDDSGHAIAIADADGHVDYMNIAFGDLFHCTLDTISEAGWQSLFIDRAISTSILDSIAGGDSWSGEAQMSSRTERRFPAEIRAAPIVSERIEIAGLMLLINDVTERKRLEQELLHARKLESIGQLAAGIAHEINTPTQYIGDNTRFIQKGFADLTKVLEQHNQLLAAVKKGVPGPELVLQVERAIEQARVAYLCEEIPDAITEALEGVDRVAEIVRAMKEFSHPGVEGKAETDINKAIQSTVTVATSEWKYVADMTMDLAPDLPRVLCLPGEFNQVILNMLVNAAHAIADVVGDGANGKGTITVSTRHDSDWVEIRIKDTGRGMTKDVQERIFDAFYTTKEVGKGTGQGLSLAHAVITRKHGGTISVDSALGEGATFVIRLPISATTTDTESEKEVAFVL